MARTTRESGFDGIFAVHHYATGPSHTLFHPLLLLAGLYSEFPGGYLGTGVYILPYTHPIIAAEATALLDVMCGGKFIFGVGRGYRAVELESFGIPRAKRGARLAEAVRAVRTLWSDDPASFDGRLDPELSLETIRRFGEEVIPLVRQHAPTVREVAARRGPHV
jgi:alkanesulfonate monooxygenase SsuD/methylene tetrahydromethanopterin reductase-like flavin-dependent oxidoreductase (luciferase family)